GPSHVSCPASTDRNEVWPSSIRVALRLCCWANCRSSTRSALRNDVPSASANRKYTSATVRTTANTITEPSLARIVGTRCSRVIAGSLVRERVADAVHGPNVAGLGAVLAQLAADAGHVRVDHASAGVVAVAPHAVHQLLAREYHAGVARHRQQDLE